jgi:hypothetical protein|tara:strand:- start:379 stop:648 length:270 start_codon:yes stop_codon:yes gene_type:complete
VAKFISKSGKEYPLDKSMNGFTAEKPKGLIKKCIHTFKCMFNKDCEKIAKSELAEMSKAELELMGRNNGIELDKRKTKKTLIDELYEAL